MIFNMEKWERIKNRREDVAQAFQAANEDLRLEKQSFEKQDILFKKDFPAFGSPFVEINEAITQLRRMDAQNISLIELKIKETLVLTKNQDVYYRRLTELLTKLIVMKRAEARKERAAEVQKNNTQCFGVLEDFARKHIKLPPSSNPAPVDDSPTYTEGL